MRPIPDKTSPFNALFDRAYASRIPLACTLELNKNCNLRCLHCYIDGSEKNRTGLSTVQVKKILRDLAAAGTLHLVFTGGEIFLRKDIYELCEYARNLRFDLRLFTNGTLIDPAAAKKISSIGVSCVEISLYGRKGSHDRITCSPGSFERSLSAIKSLAREKVPVAIKCPVTTVNAKDLQWLKRTAAELKVKLQLDPTITSKSNGNKDVLKYRISGRLLSKILREEAVFDDIRPDAPKTENLFCSAGRNMVSVDSSGNVYPCLQFQVKCGNMLKQKFGAIWSMKNSRIARVLNVKPDRLKTCVSCSLSAYCQRCPGIAMTEDNNLFGPSKIACKIAKIRKKLSS